MADPDRGRKLAGALLVLAAACLGSAGARARSGEPGALAAAAGERAPLVRIGLESALAVELSSEGPYRIVDPASGEALWRPRFEGELRIVAEGAPRGGVRAVYRVQVGAFSSEAVAEAERTRLARELGTTALVHRDPDRANWRVRVGEAPDRVELQPLVERLRGLGFADAWIAEEPGEVVRGVTLRLVDGAYESQRTECTRLVAVPEGAARLRVDGVEYRGLLELRVTAFGQVRPINWVGLEAYLRGVVPRELGPEIWPQLEALKAQAVAARTYVWRNRGQFADEGFDLCATPRCQVYGGASAEHPLSDRAVAATDGEVLTWQGRPIVAYYTATCGGHTENGEEIFPGENEPYLRGVPCRAEDTALASLRGTLAGRAQPPVVDETGADATRDWALLAAAGVVDERRDLPGEKSTAPERLRAWTARLARIAGLPEPRGPTGPTASVAEAAATLVADLGWQERSRVLLADTDLHVLLHDAEARELPEAQVRALAYLAWSEALRPAADGRLRVREPISPARIAGALARMGETYEAFGLRTGVVSAVKPDRLRLVRDAGELRLELAPRPRLFTRTAGRPVPSEQLELWPGDRLRFRTDGEGRIDFLELIGPVKGLADDRVAVVYSWDERKTRQELEQSIGERLGVGPLRDLVVLRRGVSGRIVELRVVGAKGTATVRGFDVRRTLGLRESLVVLELQRDAKGEIESVVFAGKGWGHGVGLCQVGAYGMALRGASYRDILAHYYQGARLEELREGRDG